VITTYAECLVAPQGVPKASMKQLRTR